MKKLCVLMSALMLTVLISCGDNNGPEITITTPVDGAVYAPGDTLFIQANVTDDVQITSIVLNGTNGFQLNEPLDISTASNLTSIPVVGSVALDANSQVGTYGLEIVATDNDDNTESEEVSFEIQ